MQNKQTARLINIWAQPNPWGYLFNINHPNVKRAYIKYQQENGLNTSISLTDAQRHDFEGELLKKLREHGLL